MISTKKIKELFDDLLFSGSKFLHGIYNKNLEYKINNLEVTIRLQDKGIAKPRHGRSIESFLDDPLIFYKDTPESNSKKSTLIPFDFIIIINGVFYNVPEMEYSEYVEVIKKIDELIQNFDDKNFEDILEELDSKIEDEMFESNEN